MQSFAALVKVLGTSTKTNDKLEALIHYFETANDKDKVWVIAIFSGRRPKRIVNSSLLKSWCVELAGISDWMFGECYHTVGDLAETITLLLAESDSSSLTEQRPLHYYIEQFITLDKQGESIRKQYIIDSWQVINRNIIVQLFSF